LLEYGQIVKMVFSQMKLSRNSSRNHENTLWILCKCKLDVKKNLGINSDFWLFFMVLATILRWVKYLLLLVLIFSATQCFSFLSMNDQREYTTLKYSSLTLLNLEKNMAMLKSLLFLGISFVFKPLMYQDNKK
jgi:hypothetical protein